MTADRPRDCLDVLSDRMPDDLLDVIRERPIRHGWKGRTCRDIWDASPRGDWLLDYAAMAGAGRADLVRGALACVEPVARPDDVRTLAALRRWLRDRPGRRMGLRELRAAIRREQDAIHGERPYKDMGRAKAVTWLVTAATESVATHRPVGRGAPSSAGLAAGYAAWASDDEAAAHRACADEVRRLVPFLDLSAGGVR